MRFSQSGENHDGFILKVWSRFVKKVSEMSENVNLCPFEHPEQENNNYKDTAAIFGHVWRNWKKSSKMTKS